MQGYPKLLIIHQYFCTQACGTPLSQTQYVHSVTLAFAKRDSFFFNTTNLTNVFL